jgi:streptogramin lyase
VAESTLPEPITVDDAERVKLADRLQREIEILDDPDWMVVAFGSIWMQRGNGNVFRLDPQTGKEVATFPAGPFSNPLCQGIGTSDDAIWACPPGRPAGQVVRIDPKARGRVDAGDPQAGGPGRMVSTAGQLWLLTDSGNRLTGVDLESEEPSSELRLGDRCLDLAVDGTTLWAMCPFADRVLRIDATVPEITGELELAGAEKASVGDDLWVAFEGGVAEVDPETLEVLAVYDLHARFGGKLYATPDEVWVREEDGHFLARIDPAEQRIVETIEAPQLPSGGDVVVIGDSVWATAYDDETVVQLKR